MKLTIAVFFLLMYSCPELFAQSADTLSVICNVLNKSCQKEPMTRDEIQIFLSAYSENFTHNAELCESRNEALFALIDSDNLILFLSTLKENKSYISPLLYDLKHPLHDSINIDSCIHRLKHLDDTDSLRNQILNILEVTR